MSVFTSFSSRVFLFYLAALNISVVLLGFPPETSIIRGYNQTLAFSFTVENLSPLIDIVQVEGADQNFNVTVAFSSSEDLTTVPEDIKQYGCSNIPMEQLQQGLPANNTETFTGGGEVLLSRDSCSRYHYACLIVEPGPGSTFQLPVESFRHQSCIPASNFINCEGTVLNFSILGYLFNKLVSNIIYLNVKYSKYCFNSELYS